MANYVVAGYKTPSGVNSREQVKEMQRKLGVTADGVWGAQTQAAYEKSLIKAARPSPIVKPSQKATTGYFDGYDYVVDIPSKPNPVVLPAAKPKVETAKPIAAKSTQVPDLDKVRDLLPDIIGCGSKTVKKTQWMLGVPQTGAWNIETAKAMVDHGYLDNVPMKSVYTVQAAPRMAQNNDNALLPPFVKPGEARRLAELVAQQLANFGYADGGDGFKMVRTEPGRPQPPFMPFSVSDPIDPSGLSKAQRISMEVERRQYEGDRVRYAEEFAKYMTQLVPSHDYLHTYTDKNGKKEAIWGNNTAAIWRNVATTLRNEGLSETEIQQRLQLFNFGASYIGTEYGSGKDANGKQQMRCNQFVGAVLKDLGSDYFIRNAKSGSAYSCVQMWENADRDDILKTYTKDTVLQSGDILLFTQYESPGSSKCGNKDCGGGPCTRNHIHHVAIYIDGNWIIDSLPGNPDRSGHNGVWVRDHWWLSSRNNYDLAYYISIDDILKR